MKRSLFVMVTAKVERYPDLQDAEHEELKKEMKGLDKKAKQKVRFRLL